MEVKIIGLEIQGDEKARAFKKSYIHLANSMYLYHLIRDVVNIFDEGIVFSPVVFWIYDHTHSVIYLESESNFRSSILFPFE